MMDDGEQQSTFLSYDHEALGTHSASDRPAQLTTICTDSELNVIGEPEVFYCKPADDYLPRPEAILITGTTPQEARTRGENEVASAARIHPLFVVPKTRTLGYNNVRLDSEVTRDVFYRNFYDPYAWSWQYGSSRWDLLNVMHACYALRPEGISRPGNDDSLPSFRLEYLTEANGIEHSNVHDAMADVYATTAMAKLVKTRQPRLSEYLFTYRNEHKLVVLIDVPQMKPLVHASGMFGVWHGNTSWVVPLARHPENRNAVIIVGLAGDISPLLELDSDTLRERLYTAKADLGDSAAIPVELVHINRCPVLAQASTLCPKDADRLGTNRQHCLDNLKTLRKNPQVCEKMVAVLVEAEPFTPPDNVDAQLCSGLFSNIDRVAMKIALEAESRNLPALNIIFVDKRIEKLLFSYRACNFPGTPGYAEQQR